MTEEKEHSPERRKAILDTIQELALENFQLGLRDDIQTIMRSRNYKTLTAAISNAIAEEKLKGSPSRIQNQGIGSISTRPKYRTTVPKMWQNGPPRTRLSNKSLR